MADDIYIVDPSGSINDTYIVFGNNLCTYTTLVSLGDDTSVDLDGLFDSCSESC